jgi:hypothetical protein
VTREVCQLPLLAGVRTQYAVGLHRPSSSRLKPPGMSRE